jgi:hypothetical protein
MKSRFLPSVLLLAVLVFVLIGCATTGSDSSSGDVVLSPGPAEVNVMSFTVPAELSVIIDRAILNELEYKMGSVTMRLVDYRNSLQKAMNEAFGNNFTTVLVKDTPAGTGLEVVLKRASIEPTTAIKFHAELLENGQFVLDTSGVTEARTVYMSSTVWTYVEDTKKISKQLIEEGILKTVDMVYDGLMRNQSLMDRNFWQQSRTQTAVSVFSKPEEVALQKLLAVETTNAGYGWSVATSSDGQYYVVSRPVNKVQGEKEDFHLGAAWIFEGNNPNSSVTFMDSYAGDLLFGAATAISADGSLVVIGAPGASPGQQGYLYAYHKSPSGWKSEDLYPTLFGFPGDTDWKWGIDIAISGQNGKTILVGAPGENGYGRARYFIQPPEGWSKLTNENLQIGYLGLGDAKSGDEFGRSVAISRDDFRIAVGAPGREGNRGGIYVFEKPTGGWLNTQTLFPLVLPDSRTGDRVGQSVALSSNGKIIAVGAPGADGGKGKVFVIINLDTAKGLYDYVTLDNIPDTSNLGISVDVSEDGKTIAAGALGSPHNGVIQVYRSESGLWDDAEVINKLTGRLEVASEKECMLGFSIDLTDDGKLLLAGAPNFDNGMGTFSWYEVRK